MKDFFKMLGASTLGMIIGGAILSFFSFLIFMGIAASFASTPAFRLQEKTVLSINLEGVINDRVTDNPFDVFISGSSNKGQSLNDILEAIKKAKENDRVKGIYLKAGFTTAGYAAMEPIRKALIDFKESGKFIVSYGETISQKTYHVASVADHLFMNPQGMFDFSGLGMAQQYSKEVFKKWGVDIQVFKVGTYKSAVEPYTETKMSDANREQVSSFYNDIWGKVLSDISDSREIPVNILNKYADEYLLFSDPNSIVEYGFMDALKYGPEVERYIKELVGLEEKDKLRLASVSELNTVPNSKSSSISKQKIAVLYAEGNIESDMAASIYNNNITAKEYVKELQRLKNDDNVKAVVLRVNSRGGSAYASEQILQAVKEVREKKPIVVSMGDYAASGGYYISCAANKIIAEHSTLTGSIGIFGMYPSGEQLAKRMGAHFDEVGTNKNSQLGGAVLEIPFIGIGLLPARPLNEPEQKMFQAFVERGYDLFISRCAEGRGMTKEAIDLIGQGRVWTGNQALEIGLIDGLGSLNDAVLLAAEEAGIEDYNTSYYPAQKDFFTALLEESSLGISTRFTKAVLGKETYEQKRMLELWKSFDYRQAIMLD